MCSWWFIIEHKQRNGGKSMFELEVAANLRARIEDLMFDNGIAAEFDGTCLHVFENDVDAVIAIMEKAAPSRVQAAYVPNRPVNNNVSKGGSMFKGVKGKMAGVFAKMQDSYFKKVDGVVYSVMESKIGIQTDEGVVTIEDGSLTVNPLAVFNMDIPAYAVRTPLADIRVGDIVAEKGIGFVTGVLDGKVSVIRPGGTNASFNPPTNTMLGGPAVMVVKNAFGNGGTLDPMTLMMLSSLGEDAGDTKGMLMMMAMGGLGGAGAGMAGMNPMMMAMMMGGDGDSSDMMKNMMLMQMMQGQTAEGATVPVMNPLMQMMFMK